MNGSDVANASEVVRILTAAKSVAVIGASDDGSKASGRTVRYLLRYRYDGDIYPINPRRTTVQGLQSYASLDDLPSAPELAVIVLPAESVADAIRACGRAGIQVAIIFASGYSEADAHGALAQDELTLAARESKVRVLGPNCVGAVGATAGLAATFMTGLDQDRFELSDDGIAFVSQSGAMGAFMLNMAQSTGLGMGRFFSTGNEADISLPEIIEGLVADPKTRAILGYVEGIRDGLQFRRALERAQSQHIPLCFLKVGRTQHGAAAAQSHTGALAGEDSVYDGVFEQYGVLRAHDIDHLLDVGRIFAAGRAAAGPRLTIVTISGGAGIFMTDAAGELGLQVPRWDDEWAGRMSQVLPAFASLRNPIDTTGVVATDQTVLRDAAVLSLANPLSDIVAVTIGNLDREEDLVCDLLTEAAATSDKPFVVIWVGGSGRPVDILARRGIPTFTEPLRAMRAVSALVSWSKEHNANFVQAPADVAYSNPPPALSIPSGTIVDEVAAKAILSEYGVETVAEAEVLDAETAATVAASLGFPVVLKLLSTEVVHKSDLGFVRVGLADSAAVSSAAQEMLGSAADLNVRDRRLVVQRQMSSSVEMILGMRHDAVFGPVIVLGLGGVLTELAADVQLRLPPLAAADVRSMVEGLRHRSLLAGARGSVPVDMDALTRTVLGFARFVEERGAEFDSIEVNPLLLDSSGRPVAVDALAIRHEDAPIAETGIPDEERNR